MNIAYDILNKYRWCLQEDSDFLSTMPRLQITGYEVEGNQQLQYLGNVLSTTGTNLLDGLSNTIEGAFRSKQTKSRIEAQSAFKDRQDAYRGLYNLKEVREATIQVPYFNETALSISHQWSEKVTEEAKSLATSLGESALKAGASASGTFAGKALGKMFKGKAGLGALVGLAGSSLIKSFNIKSIEDIVNIAVRAQAGLTAPYSGTEQPMYYGSTPRGEFIISFPLYNILSKEDVKKNWEFIQKIAYWSAKDRTSFFAYKSPYVFKVSDPSDASNFYTRPLSYISKLDVKNIGTLRVVDIDGKKYTVPEAYVVTIAFTEMIPMSKNLLESSWSQGDLITVTSNQQTSTLEQLKTGPTYNINGKPPQVFPYGMANTPSPREVRSMDLKKNITSLETQIQSLIGNPKDPAERARREMKYEDQLSELRTDLEVAKNKLAQNNDPRFKDYISGSTIREQTISDPSLEALRQEQVLQLYEKFERNSPITDNPNIPSANDVATELASSFSAKVGSPPRLDAASFPGVGSVNSNIPYASPIVNPGNPLSKTVEEQLAPLKKINF